MKGNGKNGHSMKVLLFSHHFYPHWGGTESYVFSLAKFLAQNRHDVTVYTYRWLDQVKKERLNELEIIRSGYLYFARSSRLLRGTFLGLQQLSDLANLNHILRRDFDLLHVQGLTWGLEAPWTIGTKKIALKGWRHIRKTPKVITFHEYVCSSNWRTYAFEAEKCEAVICNNLASAQLLKKKLKIDRVFSIPNGVDLDLFAPNDSGSQDEKDDFTIFCPSRPMESKGIAFLIQVVKEIVSQDHVKNLKLLLFDDVNAFSSGYSDRNFSYYLRKLVHELCLDEHVSFVPGRPYTEMPGLYSSSDVVVLPSSQEGFGLVIAEAMAMKKPVIANRVGGTPEVLDDGIQGYLVSPSNREELKNALLRLYADRNLREQMGVAGRKKVEEKYNLRNLVPKVLDVYMEIVSRA